MMMNQTRTAASSTVYQETSTSFSANAEPMVDQLRKRESKIQNCDFSMLAACVAEMKQKWVPAKIDQVRDCDVNTEVSGLYPYLPSFNLEMLKKEHSSIPSFSKKLSGNLLASAVMSNNFLISAGLRRGLRG